MAQGKRTSEEIYQDIEDVLDNPIVIPEGELNDDGSPIEEEEIQETLTLRQEKFCQLYALDTRFMGNGVTTYLEVYDVDQTKKGWYKTACAAASRLLSNVKVYTRINDLLEEQGLNDQFVDKQLLFVLSQQASLGAKLEAIKEYNKLKQRITDKIKQEGTLEIIFKN